MIPHRPRLISDDMVVLREATLAGIGVGCRGYHESSQQPQPGHPCPPQIRHAPETSAVRTHSKNETPKKAR